MKKGIAVLSCLIIIVSIAVFAGCGKTKDLSGSKYLGTWAATKASVADAEEGSDELVKELITIELKADGTAVGTMVGSDINCTWRETKNGVLIKGDLNVNAKTEGDELVMRILEMDVHLRKVD